MLVRDYTRRNKIARTLFVGGLVLMITSILSLGGLTISKVKIENKLKSLPSYRTDTRKTYEQSLKSNENLTYVVCGLGLLSIGTTVSGKKLHRED